MLKRMGGILVIALLVGACSLRSKDMVDDTVPWGVTADWKAVCHGVVEHVGDDYIVVRFYRVSVEGEQAMSAPFSELGIRPFAKAFWAFEPDRNGVGTNHPLFFRTGDPALLFFYAEDGVEPSEFAITHCMSVHSARQSELPSPFGPNAEARWRQQ